MQNKLKIGLAGLVLLTNVMFAPVTVKAYSSSDEANQLLNSALTDKTYYAYNMAYASIMNLQDTNLKYTMLGKLASISNVIFTKDVVKFTEDLNTLCQTGDGGLYDQIVAEVNNSSLCSMDKGYLLGELTGWGRKLVYTPDYVNAVNNVVNAWNSISSNDSAKISSAIQSAESAISSVSNYYSKKYLEDQIQQVRNRVSGIVQENFVFDQQMTDKLSKSAVDRYVSYGLDSTTANKLVQSALNIAAGKEVDPYITQKFHIKVSDQDNTNSVTDADVIYDSSNQIEFKTSDPYGDCYLEKNTPSVSPISSYTFSYSVVYKDANSNNYDVHNVNIDLKKAN